MFLARDVSERKRRKRELKTFREAVEQAGHAILITDTVGRIEYTNPAFESVTGYTTDEALGARPSLLKSGAHDDRFYKDLWRTIHSGAVWEGELINERKDGERYHIEQTIAPITDGDGTIERFVAINADITERKRHEQQIKRERDRLDEFASTIAHDLRNPISVALGYAEQAQRVRGDSAERREYLEKVGSALRRVDTMLAEVLTLSKQGQTVQEPEAVDFGEVVEGAWNHVETSAATLTLDDGLRDWSVLADEPRLGELLENLFHNAREHGGSDVTVGVGRLRDRDGFYVAHDGPGVSPVDRNRIFENGSTTSESGSGYGLAIVKQIVDAHGWSISVAASEAGGARFEIETSRSP